MSNIKKRLKGSKKNQDFDINDLEGIRRKLIVEHKPHIAPKPKKLFTILLISVILLLAVLLITNPSWIGFVTQEKEFGYNDTLNAEFTSTSEYVWNINNLGTLKSVKLYGRYLNGTKAKVYIENDNSKYLILDLDKLEPDDISSITALAVDKEKNDKNKEGKDKGEQNTIETNKAEGVNIGTNVSNQTNEIPINETETITNDTITNKTISINKSITIKLEYNKNTPYDEDDNGIEYINNVIDFSASKSSFNWNYDSSKLCTRWEIYSVEDEKLTTVCYGSGECCQQIDLLPERNEWNDTLYLSYNSLGAAYNNIVSARIIYYNETEIILSEWANLSARFEEQGVIEFENVCEDTCAISGFNKSSYKLVIEVEHGRLLINKISYSVSEEVLNSAPKLIKNISTLNLRQGRNLTIDLSDYFSDSNNDRLSYTYYKSGNLSVEFKDNKAIFTPDKTYEGIIYTFIIANDSEEIAISNVFAINVTKGRLKPKVKIGVPVKWQDKILVDLENASKINITLPETAVNVTIKIIDENAEREVPSSKIKIIEDGKEKDIDVFELEKGIENIEKKINIVNEAKQSGASKVAVDNQETDISEIESKLSELQNQKSELAGKLQKLKETKTDSFGILTGNFAALSEISAESIIEESQPILVIDEEISANAEIEVSYETEAPISIEDEVNDYTKLIKIISETPYEDVLAYTSLNDVAKESIKLYWIKNNTKEIFNDVDYLDENSNGLIDRIEWVILHLSNQTFEVSITILNVQSYPTVGGNWVVGFNTTGTGNLIIYGYNGTTYSEKENDSAVTINDLDALELRCENKVLEPYYIVDLGELELRGLNKVSGDVVTKVNNRITSLNEKEENGFQNQANEPEDSPQVSCGFKTSLKEEVSVPLPPHKFNVHNQNYDKIINFFTLIPSAYALHSRSSSYPTLDINGKTYALLTKEQVQGHSYTVFGVYYPSYNCDSKTGYWTVKVLTSGIHNQRFNFSGQIADAHNLAGGQKSAAKDVRDSDFEFKISGNKLIINNSIDYIDIETRVLGFPISHTLGYKVSGNIYPQFNVTIPSNLIANLIENKTVNVSYTINFSRDISGEIYSNWIYMKGMSYVYKRDFYCTIETNGIQTNISSKILEQNPVYISDVNITLDNGSNATTTVTEGLNITMFYNISTDVQSGSVITCIDPILPDAFCDGGDTATTCWINRTHYVNATDNILSANNVIINASGKIINSTIIEFIMNLTGNLTIDPGGIINLSGVSCTSGGCNNGSNLTITAQVVNISGAILAEGGYALGSTGNHYSGNGGKLTINAINIIIPAGGNISVSSDDTRNTASRIGGGNAGTITLNATLVNISGIVKAAGGNGDNNECFLSLPPQGIRGNGGIVNITAISVVNTGLIIVEKGSVGFCDEVGGTQAINNQGTDGQIWINNTFSPCNNGTIFDADFSKTCIISKGIRVPNNYLLNLSGKNYTIGNGARLNGDGAHCNTGVTCEAGSDFTIIVDVLNLSNGNITSVGGSQIGSGSNSVSGDGGDITINASKVYVGANSQISSGSDDIINSGDDFIGGKGGTIIINATFINSSGLIKSAGGNGDSSTCNLGTGQGHRGDGGAVIINSIDAEIFTVNVLRGNIGFCTDGDAGRVLINTSNILTVTNKIWVNGNRTGNITLIARELIVNGTINATNGTQTNSGLNGTIKLEYNLTINISTATITPPPFIAKENEFGRVQFINRISGFASLDFNKSVNITNNGISVDSEGGFLNQSANLTLKGINLIKPAIQRNNFLCGALCTNLSYDINTGIFAFNVSQFTTYTATEDICDQGTLDTQCNVTSKKFVKAGTISGQGNLFINGSGALVNYTNQSESPIAIILDFKGNITIESGGIINLSGVSCSSGGCANGSNLTIIAQVVNVSEKILAEGGRSAGGNSGNGGTITLNATNIHIAPNGEISASSDYSRVAAGIYIGGNAGTININATLVNNTGIIRAVGGTASTDLCSASAGRRGNGGIVNITAVSISNTGLINIEKGPSGRCDIAQDNSGRDGQIWINNTFSPCNNGSIFDADFSKTCKITKGIRVPNNYVINLSGKNYTLGDGARLNGDGDDCETGGACQSGENFSIILDVLNLSNGNISSDGGTQLGDSNGMYGPGGTITINASRIYILSHSELSASSDDIVNSAFNIRGSKGGIINLNATLINSTGTINANGGNGDNNGCFSGLNGDRGSGGTIKITSIDGEFSTLNAYRGAIGACNNGNAGHVFINATNSLRINDKIWVVGNGTGNITLIAKELIVNGTLNATNGTQTSSGLNGTIKLEYNLTINISTATITPPPFITKENEFGRVQFINRISGFASLDLNKSINITNNGISIDSEGGFLNQSANLTLKGIILTAIGILRNGIACPSIICTNLSYSSSTGILVFNVSQFTNYSAGENTAPVVRLDSPANNTWNGASFTATITPFGSLLNNCTLYHNNTGIWQSNVSLESAITNATSVSFPAITVNDTTFVWDAKCNNTFGSSAFNGSNFSVRIDTAAPTAFNLTTPTNSTISSNLTPTFTWNITVESNFVNYTVQVSNGTDFQTINYSNHSFIRTDGNASITIGANYAWLWRVIAFDAAGNNFTSNYFNYTTDTINPAIRLDSPSNNSFEGGNARVTFTFTAVDIHLNNCSLYHNYNSSTFNENQTNTTIVSGLAASFNMSVNESTDNSFLWNIRCYDNASNNAFNDTNFTVRVDTSAPQSFSLVSPANNTVSTNLTPNFDWADTVEGNFANYTLEVSNSTSFATINYTATTKGAVTNSSTNLSEALSANKDWYWRVIAFDEAGNNATSDFFRYITDQISPNVTIVNVTPNPAEFSSQNVTVNWTSSDTNLNTTQVNVSYPNGSLFSTYTANFTLTTDNLSVVGNYTINLFANDTAGNSNTTSIELKVQDTTRPTAFDLIGPADGTRSNELTPTLDWQNTTEANFMNYTIELSTSSSFSFVNLTFKTNGSVTNSSVILTQALDAGINWSWRVIAYDKENVSRISTSAFRYETFTNNLPAIPVLNSLPNNSEQIYDNINFTWSNSSDSDNHVVTYEIFVSRNTSFTDIDFNATNLTSNHSALSDNASALSGGLRYWRVRAYDGFNYSNYSEYGYVRSIVVILNITSPANNTIFYPANVSTITYKILNSSAWVNNSFVTLNNTNYTASNDSNTWEVNITLSNLTARYINITPYGYNGTTNLTISNYVTIIISKADTSPLINYVCPNETYAVNNTNISLKMKATLDTIINTSNLTLTLPSGVKINLSKTSISEENLVYTITFNHTINETGDHNLTGFVKDIESKVVNKTFTFSAISNTKTVNLSAINTTSIKLRDVCSNDLIANGSQLLVNFAENVLANAEIVTAKPTVTLNDANLTNTSVLLNYTDLQKNISAPSGKRIATEFEIKSNISFKNVTVSYNYSSIESALDDETSLVMYRCSTQDSCSSTAWELLTSTVNTTTNIISTTVNSLSVFLVAETATTTTTKTETKTVTETKSSGGGGGSLVEVPKIVKLDVIIPQPLTMYLNDSISVPIIVKNTGEIEIKNVTLDIINHSTSLSLKLSKNMFEKIGIGESISTTAIIGNIANNTDRSEITFIVNGTNPSVRIASKIYIEIVERFKENKTIVIEKTKFLADLFKNNPECLELRELLNQAEVAAKKGEFQKANALIESAINACREIISYKVDERVVPQKPKRFRFKLNIPILMVFILITIALILYFSRRIKLRIPRLHTLSRKVKRQKIGPTKNEEYEINKLLKRKKL